MFVQLLPEQLLSTPSAGLGRIRQCDASTGQVSGSDGLDFDPSTGGKDTQWVLSNPVCLSVILYSYVSVRTSINMMNAACGNPGPTRFAPSLIADVADMARATRAAASGNCSLYLAAAGTAMGSFMAVLGTIYGVAHDAYRNTKICGDGWYGPNTSQYNLYGRAFESRTIHGYPASINTIQKIIDACSTDTGTSNFESANSPKTCDSELNLSTGSKEYREYFYGGVEVDDNAIGSAACLDPYRPRSASTAGSSAVDRTQSYHKQRYYMKGYEEGNFNCQKYRITNSIDPLTGAPLTAERRDDFNNAYECCLNRSANYVCINYKGNRKFCRADSQCTISINTESAEAATSTSSSGINFVTFQTKSRDRGSKICVETYSLCPYNFYVRGGATICDYYKDTGVTQEMVDSGQCGSSSSPASEVRDSDCEFNNRAGKCKNYCQYMTHCAKTSNISTHAFTSASPYMSEACINFSGDSRNRVTYGSGFLHGTMRHFSAPIVQCFKETLENVFYNKAGHNRCINTDEDVGIDISGVCPSGFSYEKGQSVASESFFEKFQRTLTTAIKVALTLVIAFYGFKILLGAGEVKKKDLMMLIVKIALVMYFATGNAWKDTFFDGVYSASTFFAELVFKVQSPSDENKRDGCQFGKVYTSISQGSTSSTMASSAYPAGKTYLAIWDTLDCKLARYMGFGPQASVANIALLVIAGWLIGPIGAYFVTCIFIFGFLMISMIIRAVHIFLASTIAIILLIFISPITITCILTEKTKDIFNNWLKQLMSYAIQPIILFTYLAIMVSVLDKSLVGSARFAGSAPAKTINCTSYCVESNGTPATGVSLDDCDTNNRYIVKPKSDSFECMISSNAFGRFPGLEIIGLSIPFLLELFTEDPKKKMLTLIRGLMIIYFLFKFMDEVPNIASQLFGGSTLPQSGASARGMFNKTAGIIKGTQKRLGRGAKNAAKGAGRAGLREIRKSGGNRKGTSSKDSASGGDGAAGKGGDGAAGKGGDGGGSGGGGGGSGDA